LTAGLSFFAFLKPVSPLFEVPFHPPILSPRYPAYLDEIGSFPLPGFAGQAPPLAPSFNHGWGYGKQKGERKIKHKNPMHVNQTKIPNFESRCTIKDLRPVFIGNREPSTENPAPIIEKLEARRTMPGNRKAPSSLNGTGLFRHYREREGFLFTRART
jgi:hypothetical protein